MAGKHALTYLHLAVMYICLSKGGLSKKALNIQEDSRCKGIQGNTSKAENKCVCLSARSIINKKNELNIMVDDIKPHIIGITESWAHNDITDAELGLEDYVMFRKDRIGKKGRRSITIHQGHYTSIRSTVKGRSRLQ